MSEDARLSGPDGRRTSCQAAPLLGSDVFAATVETRPAGGTSWTTSD